jgi:hypothetical protein
MEHMCHAKYLGWCMVMVFNAIIKNMSSISWGVSFIRRMKTEYSVKTLSHKIVSSTHRLEQDSKSKV